MPHLLIVEDDELLRDALTALLQRSGHQVTGAESGERALLALADHVYDGIVLDLGLPGIGGLEVLRRVRALQAALPVLILTARDGVDSRVEGLKAGADDYLTKPFDTQELLARIQAMLRRASLPAFEASAASAPAGALRIEDGLPRAWLGSTVVELTRREWVLLRLLKAHAGQVVSREMVLSAWQADESGEAGDQGGTHSNAVEVYVHRLRRKLGERAPTIRNIRGLGYMLDLAPQ